MFKIVLGGAFGWCAIADDPDVSSLLQRRELSQVKVNSKSCADDPNCIPLPVQCCADWIASQEDGCGTGYTAITTGTTQCLGECARDHCCHQSCAGALDGATCPDNHSPKFADLTVEACAACTADSAIETCCEEHAQCPSCTGGEKQMKPVGAYCLGVDCGNQECCKPTCESRLTGGVCPAGHSAKVNLGNTLCVGSGCNPVDTCCEEHATCPSCTGGEKQMKPAGTSCIGVECGNQECCKPTCESRLTGGVCPAGHSAKVNLGNTLCVGSSCDPVDTCCEEHAQCPACTGGEKQMKPAGTYCTGVQCGAKECCKPTCESRLDGGVCPSGYSAKVNLGGTLCVGSSCDPVETCCEEHEQCPSCTGGEKQMKPAGTYCTGVQCGAKECCKPTCESRLAGGVCPSGHSAKVNLGNTLCVGGSCDPVDTCCEEHAQCPACTGGEKQMKPEGTYCTGVQCGAKECCKPTCESRLDGGVCPAGHSAKVNLGNTLCVGSSCDPVDTCCEEHAQCPACTGGRKQMKPEGTYCTGVDCGTHECCKPTCESRLPLGVCPDHHTAKVDLGNTVCVGSSCNPVTTCCEEHEQCPTCNADEIQKKTGHCDAVTCSDEECCDPATCGATLSKPCDEISHHDWAVGFSSMSPCSVAGQPCTAAQAFGKCCDHPDASVTPPQMKYCSLYGDPHIRTFDGKDQNNGQYLPLPNNAAYRAGVFWLVNHDDVKIQARFGTASENGYSRLLGLGIDVKGVNVWIDNSPTNVKVKGSSVKTAIQNLAMNAVHTVSAGGLDQVTIQRRSTPPYTATGTNNVHLQSQNPDAAYYYRFPGFADDGAERSFVELYVQGRSGHLDAAIYMMRAEDFTARHLSGTITGLCGNSDGSSGNDYQYTQGSASQVGASLSAFAVANDIPPAETVVCSANQRTHWEGRCDACVSSSCPNRDSYIAECVDDYCAGEEEAFVDMDCNFVNNVACQL